MGGMDVRRKPLQDSPTPAGNSVAAIALSRLYGFTGKKLYRERAQATLEAFAGVASKFGMFAASYGLAAVLHARGALQVIVTGAADDLLSPAVGAHCGANLSLRKSCAAYYAAKPIQGLACSCSRGNCAEPSCGGARRSRVRRNHVPAAGSKARRASGFAGGLSGWRGKLLRVEPATWAAAVIPAAPCCSLGSTPRAVHSARRRVRDRSTIGNRCGPSAGRRESGFPC